MSSNASSTASALRRQMSKTKERINKVKMPKMNILNRTSKRKNGEKENVSKQEVKPKRVPCPDVPEELVGIVKSGKFAVFVGDDLFLSGAEGINYKALLQRVCEKVKDKQLKQDVSVILTQKNADTLQKATQKLVSHFGEKKFYILLKDSYSAARNADDVITDSDTLKLLQILGADMIISTSYDNTLDTSLENACVFTIQDMFAAELSLDDVVAKAAGKQLVLKINGDISRADTIPFLKNDLFKQYGYEVDGTKIAEEGLEMSEAKFFQQTMSQLFQMFHVLFLSSSFNKSEPLLNFLHDFKISNPENKSTHFALVDKSEEIAAKLSDDTGVSCVSFVPDENKTQVVEFLAQVAALKASESSVVKAFMQSQYPHFLEQKLAEEKSAVTFSVYTEEFPSMLLFPEGHLSSTVLPVLLKSFSMETADKIIDMSHQRKMNVEAKLTGEGPFAFKLLISEQGISSETELPLLQHLVDLNLDSKGKLLIRIMKSEIRSEVVPGEVIMKRTNGGFNEIVSSKSTYVKQLLGSDQRSLYWMNINTSESKQRFAEFETVWNSGSEVVFTEAESLEVLKAKISELTERQQNETSTSEVAKEAEKTKDQSSGNKLKKGLANLSATYKNRISKNRLPNQKKPTASIKDSTEVEEKSVAEKSQKEETNAGSTSMEPQIQKEEEHTNDANIKLEKKPSKMNLKLALPQFGQRKQKSAPADDETGKKQETTESGAMEVEKKQSKLFGRASVKSKKAVKEHKESKKSQDMLLETEKTTALKDQGKTEEVSEAQPEKVEKSEAAVPEEVEKSAEDDKADDNAKVEKKDESEQSDSKDVETQTNPVKPDIEKKASKYKLGISLPHFDISKTGKKLMKRATEEPKEQSPEPVLNDTL